MKRFYGCMLLWAFGCLIAGVNAQEQLGLRTENYAGINATITNPAAHLTSKFKWDINLGAGGIFGENNYGLIRNSNFFHLLKNGRDGDNIFSATYTSSEFKGKPSWVLYDFYDNDKTKYFAGSLHIMGPSVAFKLNNGQSFGLITTIRGGIAANNIPANTGYYVLDRTPFEVRVPIAPGKMAGMLWSEIGINYGFSIETYSGRLGFGITAKYLQGHEAAYIESLTTFDLSRYPENITLLEKGTVNFGFTDTNTNIVDDGLEVAKNGQGFGFDLGVVLTIEGEEGPYDWRLGFSILDLGSIKFNQRGQRHTIIQPQDTTLGYLFLDNFKGFTDGQDYVRLLSEYTLGDPLASRSGSGFTIGLPTAISLQADYYLREHIFINATWMQRINLYRHAVERGNLLAIAPRYESRWFTASVPISIFNYRDVRLGINGRLGFLILGSDNVGSLIGKSTFTGFDFYFGVKLNNFNIGPWAKGGRGGKGAKCYDF